MKMFVFSAQKPLSRTSAPIAFTPSRLVICWLVQGRMIYPPSRAVRPINPDTVAKLAAEERVARQAERFGLGVEQRVLDGAEPLGDNASGSRTGEAIQLGIDPLVVEHRLSDDPPGKPLDDGADPGEPKPSSTRSHTRR